MLRRLHDGPAPGLRGPEAVPEGSWFCKFCVADGVLQRCRGRRAGDPWRRRAAHAARVVRARAVRRRGGGPSPRGAVGRRAARRPAVAAVPGARLATPRARRSRGADVGLGAAPAPCRGACGMAAPQHREVRFTDGAPARRVGARTRNKHRAFDGTTEGGLRQGDERVYRTAQGDVCGAARRRVSLTGPSGILCDCCGGIVSCSCSSRRTRGRAERRQPYENIYTAEGIRGRQLALLLPELGAEDEDGGDAGEDEGEGCGARGRRRDGRLRARARLSERGGLAPRPS